MDAEMPTSLEKHLSLLLKLGMPWSANLLLLKGAGFANGGPKKSWIDSFQFSARWSRKHLGLFVVFWDWKGFDLTLVLGPNFSRVLVWRASITYPALRAIQTLGEGKVLDATIIQDSSWWTRVRLRLVGLYPDSTPLPTGHNTKPESGCLVPNDPRSQSRRRLFTGDDDGISEGFVGQYNEEKTYIPEGCSRDVHLTPDNERLRHNGRSRMLPSNRQSNTIYSSTKPHLTRPDLTLGLRFDVTRHSLTSLSSDREHEK